MITISRLTDVQQNLWACEHAGCACKATHKRAEPFGTETRGGVAYLYFCAEHVENGTPAPRVNASRVDVPSSKPLDVSAALEDLKAAIK